MDVDEKGRAARTLHHMLKVFLIDACGEVREIYSLAFLQPQVSLNRLENVERERHRHCSAEFGWKYVSLMQRS